MGLDLTAKQVLKQYFGHDVFRDGQETLINALLENKDVLGIMPTGAGKSMCFQIPALLFSGITIVISPLISLMKDQVNALTAAGIRAAFINSSLSEGQIAKALHNARNGAYKLIYVAPERLLTPDFLAFAENADISMLAVDEAHCISQWGQDFRPSYAQIPEFIEKLPKRLIVSAFTATATPRVCNDITERLALNEPTVLVAGFDRKNLYFSVQKPKDKFAALTLFLKDRHNAAGIVYCSTRAAVEEVCANLNANGHNASRYHAGLSDLERHTNQEDFIYDRVQIMVATNAFGMGIDKSNVSFVVHYNMPKDMEGYYQEAGRAGRDGEPADCVLFYSGQDVRTNLWLIENGRNPDRQIDEQTERMLTARDKARLNTMIAYCSTTDCLRYTILKYFGETPDNQCGNCLNCNTTFESIDITVDALKILSCVTRMKERYGVNMVIDVLRGSKNEKAARLGLNNLSTFGISEKSDRQLRMMFDQLISGGYLVKTTDEYPVIKLGERANDVLRNGASVFMKYSKELETPGGHSSKTKMPRTTANFDKGLFEHLAAVRLAVANEQKVPAYVVFHNSTLTDMCMVLPKTADEFLDVSGVGKAKAEQYGERFLNAIAQYLQQNNAAQTKQPRPPKQYDPAMVDTSEDNVSVSILADQINCVLMQTGNGKLTGQKINNWLVSQGYMELVKEDGKSYKIPTDKGLALGITSEQRDMRGETVKMNFFNQTAQKFVAENAIVK